MVTVMEIEAIGGDWAGRVIDGKFTLLKWLGGSDANGVFLTQIELDQPHKAAIRLIPASLTGADAQLAHWKAASSLSHPHVMRLYDTGSCHVDGSRFFYSVTEYAEENLSEILPHRPLTPAEAGEMLDPLLQALSYLHAKGFTHGHLKPSNILVVNDHLKLSSDNIQPASKPYAKIQAGDIHDAPECSTGAVSPATDIWSLGVTLVEALTQHPPAWDRGAKNDPVVPPSIAEPFAGIARESLRTDPARRCSLDDIGDRLKAPQTTQESPAVPVQSSPVFQSETAAPAKFRLLFFVAPALVALALIAFLLMRSQHAEPPQAAVQQQSDLATAQPPAASPAPEIQSSKPPAEPAHDKNAAVIEQVLPDVLPKAMASIHGQFVVKVRVSVDADGAVTDAGFDSEGPSRYFANAALNASRRWKFRPAVVSGQPVGGAWLLQFRFRREGTEVTPVQLAR